MSGDDLSAGAETAIRQCLALQPDESCLVVTDDERLEIGRALYAAAVTVSDEVSLMQYPPGEEHGTEPPALVAAAMRTADTFLAPTTASLSHTRARQAACEAGGRGATLPEITSAVFRTGLAADYTAIAERCDRLYNQLSGADTVRVTAPQGTDITFEIGKRTWRRDTGRMHDPGDFSNLPAGEVFVSPESADGTYVVDGTIRPHGLLADNQTVRITVEDGYATEIDDPAVRGKFERAAESVGQDAYNVAELGVGANSGVTTLVGSVLLDEKAAGTVHIALGDDASIGGDTDAPIHADGILREPRLFVDGDEVALRD